MENAVERRRDADPARWRLAWSDEFNARRGTPADPENWTHEIGDGTIIGKPGLQVAVITKRPNGYFITHVEGATYPTLNGASLGAQARPLNDHDLIEIAGVKMEFFYKP